jgi:TrmH family RNA methyltransferase
MRKAELITSSANPLLKDVRRAIAKGGLTEQGLCVAETFHLLEEALRSDCDVRTVLAAESVRAAVEAHVRRLPGTRVTVLPDDLFQRIAGTETSQGVIALVNPPAWRLEQLFRGRTLVIVLDNLQDPGNAGTIARAAEAFGATGILSLKGSVSSYNPKVIRASAGSVFRVPYLHGVDSSLARAAFQQNKAELYAAAPARPDARVRMLSQVDLAARCGIIIGNEGRGVSEDLRGAALDISIPKVGVESLNAAIAAGILLYEARRQRAARE